MLNMIGAIEEPTSGTVDVAGHTLSGLDEDGRTSPNVNRFFDSLQGSFDAVVSVEMLEHIRNHPDLLDRLAAPPLRVVTWDTDADDLGAMCDAFDADVADGGLDLGDEAVVERVDARTVRKTVDSLLDICHW